MRTVEQSFELIRRQLENSANHLKQHSTRKELAENNYGAIKELSKLQDQVSIMQATLEGQELRIAKMFQVWNDMLLKLYLFMCINMCSSDDFYRVIQQPIDLLITPYEAMRKDAIQPKCLSYKHNTLEENIALVDENEKQYALVEEEVQNDIVATKRQLEQIITKSLNR